MKLLVTHAAVAPTLAVLLAGGACDANKATHTPAATTRRSTITGTVNGKAAHRLISPGPRCRTTPTPAQCKPWWRLEIRDKAGRDHLIAVTRSVYDACHLNASWPTCAEGA